MDKIREEKFNTLETVIKTDMDTLLPLMPQKVSVSETPWVNKNLMRDCQSALVEETLLPPPT